MPVVRNASGQGAALYGVFSWVTNFLALPAAGNRLQAILARGELRVCYWLDNLPFAYFNEAKDLVGFDIDQY